MKNFRTLMAGAIASLLTLLALQVAHAEDIDLYAGLSPGGSNPPTILLVWDTAANTSASATTICTYADSTLGTPSLGANTAAGMEQCALVNALTAIRNDVDLVGRINIGLMIYNKNSFSNNGNGQCGYLDFAPRLMDTTGINALIARIVGYRSSGNNSMLANGASVGTTMAEAWAMLNGKSTSCSGVDYSSYAQSLLQCRDSVLVFIGNAFTNSNPADGVGGADALLKSELTGVFNYRVGSNAYSLYATPISVSGLNTSGNANNNYWADEWARFMKHADVSDSGQSDRNITTYTISVTDFGNRAQAQSTINYYAEMAEQGAGKTFLVDLNNSASLVASLMTIFNEVQSVNSVFASATLPVSANTQGNYLNQVFIAMFRPDGNALPRWLGNLKQYQLGLDAGGNLVLTDSTQNPDSGPVTSKTNPVTGTIAPDAISFWTTNSPGVSGWPSTGFWVNAPAGDGLQYDSPDGDLVEKGGAGQSLRAANLTATYADTNNDNSRKLLTCDTVGGCSSTLTNFDTGNTNLTSNAPALFGVSPQNNYTNVAISAGISFVSSATASCSTGNNPKSCAITIPFTSGPTITAGNTLFNNLASNAAGACPLTGSGCAVLATPAPTATQFSYTVGNAGNQTFTVTSGTRFYRGTTSITATFNNHGLAVGDVVTLTGCSGQADSSSVKGLAALPAGTSTASVTIQAVTTDTFTLGWTASAVTTGGTAVSCTVRPAVNAHKLINWIRGWDVAGNEEADGPCDLVDGVPVNAGCAVTARPSLHGDVLHSRPAVVNYGGSTGVVIFYGGNDGIFRAINGNQQTAIGGVRAGGELWGFIAPEFFGKFKRLYQNTPVVDIEGVQDPNALPKDYFFDGNTSLLRDTRTGTSTAGKTYLFLSARRGGRLLYALDVSNPSSPVFLWRRTDADIPELGQTWSEPKIALVRGYPNPLLVFGAGYDPAEDTDPGPTGNSMGRGVIMLDATDGAVVWAALPSCSGITTTTNGHCVASTELTRAIPADVTLLDRNFDGYIDRIYAADVGANIWRIDLEPTGYGAVDSTGASTNTPATWALSKLAALGGTGNNARKFLYAPDVVPTNNYDAVIAISGDREHPLYTSDTTAGLAYNVVNRFYMVMDRNIGPAVPNTAPTLTEANLEDNSAQMCLSALQAAVSCRYDTASGNYLDSIGNVVTPMSYTGEPTSINGYYVTLRTGEKGVNAPTTLAGKTYFGTNQPSVPSSTSCESNLGTARAYIIDFYAGTREIREFTGGGLPPSPISGLVTIGNQTVPFVIGGAGPTPFDPITPAINLPSSRKRAFWYYH